MDLLLGLFMFSVSLLLVVYLSKSKDFMLLSLIGFIYLFIGVGFFSGDLYFTETNKHTIDNSNPSNVIVTQEYIKSSNYIVTLFGWFNFLLGLYLVIRALFLYRNEY